MTHQRETAVNLSILVPIAADVTLELMIDKDYEDECEIDAHILQENPPELIPAEIPLLEIQDEHRQLIVNALIDLITEVRCA